MSGDIINESKGVIEYEKFLIGEGTSRTKVYLGKWDKRKVAVKVVPMKKCKKNAVREVQSLRKIEDNSSIVKYYYVEEGDDKNTIKIAMELCDGNIEDLMNDEKLNQSEWTEVARQLMEGICHLHKNKIVHRDLKPNNILYKQDESGNITIKISDFGSSKFTKNGMWTLTNAPGTRGWTAKEILDRSQKITKKVKIYFINSNLPGRVTISYC